MLKRCGYEDIKQAFDRIINTIQEKKSIGYEELSKELDKLLVDLISDYSILKQEIEPFLIKYSSDYLNHIQKYNDKITLNMTFSYDQNISLTVPDFAVIRHFSEFDKLIKEIMNDHKIIGKIDDLIFYRDKLKNVYSFFYKSTETNKTSSDNIDIMYKSIHYSQEENSDEKTININETELKKYYSFLEEIFRDKYGDEEVFGITQQYEFIKELEKLAIAKEKTKLVNVNYIKKTTTYFTELDSNDLNPDDADIGYIKLKFMIKLYIYIITGIQIYTFFKSLIESNKAYDTMSKEKESHKYDNQITKNEILGVDNNLIQESVEDVVLNLFNINSYENLNELLSLEDKDIENLVTKAAKIKEDQFEGKTEGEEEEDKKPSLFKRITNKVAQIPIMTKTFSNKVRMFLNNRKSKWLYSRTLGKMDGLFEQYGGDAQIKENNFKDDPVIILKDQLTPDIIRIGKEVAVLCDEVENLMKKASNMSSPDGVIGLANEWVKGSKIPDLSLAGEKTENLTLKKKIIFGTRSRLVNILCKNNNKIYGFSYQSMVVKKLPPPNIFVISYFLLNFQEVPQAQRVSDIFKSADSFRIMANAEKKDIFQISELMNAVLKNKLTAETFERIEMKRKETNAKMRKTFKDNGESELDKEKEKQYKDSMNGFEESLKVMFKQKLYIAEMINVFANMIMRIDNLCVNSLKSMLAVEATRVDPRFRNQIGSNVLYNTKHNQDIAEGNKFVNEKSR